MEGNLLPVWPLHNHLEWSPYLISKSFNNLSQNSVSINVIYISWPHDLDSHNHGRIWWKETFKVDLCWSDIFLSAPTSCRIWNNHVPYQLPELAWISYSISKGKFSCSNGFILNGQINPPPLAPNIMLPIELRMIILQTHVFGCPFLDQYLTTYHSN